MLFLVLTLLTGCSPAEEPIQTPEYIYIAETLSAPENCSGITQFAVLDDDVYFIAQIDETATLYTMRVDGTGIRQLPDYSPPDNTRPVAMSFDNDGRLCVAEHDVYQGGSVSKVTYYIRTLDKNGAEISRLDISEQADLGAGTDDVFCYDKNGDIYKKRYDCQSD